MSNLLPITFTSSPLPYKWSGTPNELRAEITSRLRIEAQEQYALIYSGSTEPTSNIGPWLKDGNQWYVWSDATGNYVPATVAALADLDTIPFRGDATAAINLVFAAAGSQSTTLSFTEQFDAGNCFGSNVFTAPVDGIYHFDLKCGAAATAGTPGGNTVLLYLTKNGIQMPKEVAFEGTDDVIGRVLSVSTNLQLAAGDAIGAGVSISVASSSGTWTITQNDTSFSGFRVRVS